MWQGVVQPVYGSASLVGFTSSLRGRISAITSSVVHDGHQRWGGDENCWNMISNEQEGLLATLLGAGCHWVIEEVLKPFEKLM